MKKASKHGLLEMEEWENGASRSSPHFKPNKLEDSLLGFEKKYLRQGVSLRAPTYMMRPKVYPHRKAILQDYSGDVTRRWYVEYYMWDEATENLKRHRNYKYFNACKTIEERYKVARKKIRTINDIIPYTCSYKEEDKETLVYPETQKIAEACKQIIETKYPRKKNRKSHLTFTSMCANFSDFCAKRGKYFLMSIDKRIAQEWIDNLSLERKVGPNTIRNNHGMLRTVFEGMLKREWIKENPFANLDLPKKKSSTANEAFSLEEIALIKAEILETFPELWPVLLTIYYTYLRPVEIGRLKVENVLLDQRKIFIPGSMAKVDKNSFISIPDPLAKVYEKMRLLHMPKDYFLFGSDCVPGRKQVAINFFYRHHLKVLQKLEIRKKTLYSWKHTGVVEAYKNGVDIKSIQMQCRHSSIEQTDVYLKSLGFIDNERFMTGVKEI